MSEMFIDNLRNRIRAMNTLWERAAADLTLEQVNHHERAGVLPLAFSFAHFIKSEDGAISRTFLDEPPLWEQGDWAQRTGVSVDKGGRTETVEEMEQIRFGDWDAWRAFQTAVVERTDRALAGITEEQLAEIVIEALPANMADSYCAIVVGGQPVRKLDALECFVYQHGLRHMGEVEHGRSLVGLGGMTS